MGGITINSNWIDWGPSYPLTTPFLGALRGLPGLSASSTVDVPCQLVDHRSPPVTVRTIVPSWPTAIPVSASVKNTALRRSIVPLSWAVHVSPPLVVRNMTPPDPTAVPVLSFIKSTDPSDSNVPHVCGENLLRECQRWSSRTSMS